MIFEVKNLEYGYTADKRVFQDVNFALEKGDIFTILGPNGAGKSTLLNCLCNIFSPDKGCVYLNQRPVSEYSLSEQARLIGYVPQNHMPAYDYEVKDFVVMGRAPYLKAFQQPGKVDYEIVYQVLEELNLLSIANKPYTQISGGERQQALIARALVQQPDIILFDEPTNHLDYGNQLRSLKMILELSQKGYTVILTTHMPDHAIFLDGKVGILGRDGRFDSGMAPEILEEGRLQSLYDTDLRILYVEELGRRVCVAGSRSE